MTSMVADQNISANDAIIANAVIACGGDVRLVAEQLSERGINVTPQIVLEAFMAQASSTKIQDSVKAMILLGFLELLTDLKDHAKAAMADFSPSEIMSTMKMVVEGIAQMMPQPVAQPANVNLFQNFGMDQARSKVEAQLGQMVLNDPNKVIDVLPNAIGAAIGATD